MERKWYEEWYDKNLVSNKARWKTVQKKSSGWEIVDKFVEKKKKLKVNLIELVVWLVLLWFCWQYLQTHPVEKISLFSWFDVIIQKVNIRLSADGDDLKEKYELERNYSEVLSLAEWSSCLDDEWLAELKNRFDDLKSSDVHEFMKDESMYRSYIWLTYTQVKRDCAE